MPEHILSRFNSTASEGADTSVMLDAMREFDWGSTSAGEISSWEEPLKHAARLMLLAATPMALLLGREGLLAYNDPMRDLFGPHYDGSLARPIGEALPDTASFYRGVIDTCFSGQSRQFTDQKLTLYRDGEWRTAWFDLSFTPVADVDGRVSGILLIVSETTARVTALRDLQQTQKRLDVAMDASGIVGAWDIDVATNLLTGDERFARLFEITTEDAAQGVDNDILVDRVHPDERDGVRLAVEHSMRSGVDYNCRYRVMTSANGQRWYLDAGRTIRDDEGRIERLTGLVIDLTDQISIEDALYESEARFRAFVESIPQIVWGTDAEGRHDYFNSRWTDFTGLDPKAIPADEWMRLVHPADWPSVAQTWNECLATGAFYDVEYRFRHRSGDYRWLRVMALPVRDREGVIARWYGTATDIDDQKHLADERDLVANELEHRIRNIFALVHGLVALSVREHPEVAPIAADFQQRLEALHRAHGLIRGRARTPGLPASIQALVRMLLEPYDAEAGRIAFAGDDAELKEAMVTPLALVFHELASNAAKYGALAVPAGRLSVTCRREGGQMRICWRETGAPPPAPASEPGDGSRLLSLTIERQLKGRYSREYTPDGLRFEFAIPLSA